MWRESEMLSRNKKKRKSLAFFSVKKEVEFSERERLKNKKGYNLTPPGIVGSGEGIKENS